MISKDDLFEEMKERENPPLTQKQLDEFRGNKSEVAEHLKNIDFSKHSQPTETEAIAKRMYEFSHISGNRKSRNEY